MTDARATLEQTKKTWLQSEFNALYKAWCRMVKEKIEEKGGKPKVRRPFFIF